MSRSDDKAAVERRAEWQAMERIGEAVLDVLIRHRIAPRDPPPGWLADMAEAVISAQCAGPLPRAVRIAALRELTSKTEGSRIIRYWLEDRLNELECAEDGDDG